MLPHAGSGVPKGLGPGVLAEHPARAAVVGVGDLRRRFSGEKKPQGECLPQYVYFMSCGTVHGELLAVAGRHQAGVVDLCVLVDAAAGILALLEWTEKTGASSHTFSPSSVCLYSTLFSVPVFALMEQVRFPSHLKSEPWPV